MPLKLYPPRKSPFWSVRGTYLGIYVDRSTKSGKRATAEKIRKKWEREIECGEFAEKGEATFASAAATYMKAGGERTYMTPLLQHFGEKPLRQVDQAAIDVAAEELYPNASAATRNRQVYTPVSAVLRYAKLNIDLRRPKGSAGNKTTVWLWPEQAFRLFDAAEMIDPRFAALLILLCYTGMRLSEALGLGWETTRLTEGFAYLGTSKNDEARAIFLPPVVVAALANIAPPIPCGRIFPWSKGGHLYSMLRAAACHAEVELPPRSAFHILCHTYATWMRREAGLDTKGLVATGRWKDRKSADRYEHVVVSEEAKKASLLPVRKIRGE